MDLVAELEEVNESAARDPASAMTWAPWAEKFLADTHLRRFLRKANQIGGTTVLVADCVHELRGTNPYRPRRYRGPVNCFWFGVSMEQMSQPGGVLHKLWNMIPPGEVHPKVRFVPGKGIVGTKHPHLPFVLGPNAGGALIFRTFNQDPQTFAGVTAHGAWCDEPTPQATYDELNPRLWKNNAPLTIGFTPTPDMPDMTWLRKMVECEHPQFSQHFVPLTEEACWPRGYQRPFYTNADIEEMRRQTPEASRPMRFEASWEPFITERWLTAFGDHCIRPIRIDDLPPDHLICVGTDFGLKPGTHASVLLAVSGYDTDRPKVWVFDEYSPDEPTRIEQNAAGIMRMLANTKSRYRENGLQYLDVDLWVADQDAKHGKVIRQKGHADLKRELARLANIPLEQARFIKKPWKGRGSIMDGLELLNALAARTGIDGTPDLVVHPKNKLFIEACRKFRGRSDDPHKHILDATRYPAVEAIGYRNIMGGRAVLNPLNGAGLTRWS